VGVGEEYPHLSKKAINIPLPFANSCLCQTEFSGVADLNTKLFYSLKINKKHKYN
jgi:hypothetical protein